MTRILLLILFHMAIVLGSYFYNQQADAALCPVTGPDPNIQPSEEVQRALFGYTDRYVGNEALITTVPPNGIVQLIPEYKQEDGRYGIKWGWYRYAQGVLEIRGTRLDGESEPLEGVVADGYGSSGFQSSGIIFPEAGCWLVSGILGDSEISFVIDAHVPIDE